MNYDSPISEIESTAEDFQLIRDFIHEKSGVFFSESRMHLVRDRLAKRMQDVQVKSLRDYYYHVKYDTSLREFQQLMNLVTTNETGFFRNQPQLQSFSSEVLPQFLDLRTKNKEPKVLRVWSAGCSTGEEPYSLAILLLDMLQDKPGWSCEIFANDISEEVLTMARIGEYSGATLSNVSADHMARYFTMTSEGARVNQEVKALVRFSHLNLNDPRKMCAFYRNGRNLLSQCHGLFF